jgi:hypothetical protein
VRQYDRTIQLTPNNRESSELRLLFHRLNNELGVILANAELLKANATDDVHRARAAQIVVTTLNSMGTVREIRQGATEE